MKRGFALLETMIVITFVLVSLLLLYKSVNNMYKNTRQNIIYDDVSNIYKTYYLKEYISLNNDINTNYKELTCNNLNINNCLELFKELNLNKIYIVDVNNKDINNPNLKEYLNSLNNKDIKYRFIGEFIDNKTYSYASLGYKGEDNE